MHDEPLASKTLESVNGGWALNSSIKFFELSADFTLSLRIKQHFLKFSFKRD